MKSILRWWYGLSMDTHSRGWRRAYFIGLGENPRIRIGCNNFSENDVSNLEAIINLVQNTGDSGYSKEYSGDETSILVVRKRGVFFTSEGLGPIISLEDAKKIIRRFNLLK